MFQEIAVYIIISFAIFYTILTLLRKTNKSHSPCNGCNGCDIKKEINGRIQASDNTISCGCKSKIQADSYK